MSEGNYWVRATQRRASRRTVVRGAAAAGAGLGAWAVAGCGDDDSSSKKTTAATSPATAAGTTAAGSATSAASATAQVRRGGDLVITATAEPNTMDYHKQGSGTGAASGYGVVYSRLVQAKVQGTKGAIIPEGDLAESWQQPDNTTYVFKMRANAKWQNVTPMTGRAVTADDVVYSFKRQITEKVNAANGLPGLAIAGITAIDPMTVQLKLDRPSADFLPTLTSGFSRIVPHETVELKGDLAAGPIVGSGPWIFKQWQKGVTQDFVKNPDYWISGLPYTDNLRFPLITDPAQMEAQLRAGNTLDAPAAQVSIGVPLKTLQGLDKTKFVNHTGLPSAPVMIMFELGKAPFSDPRLRRAIGMSMDRDLISANIFDGLLVPDASAMALQQYLLPADEVKKLMPYSPKDAKALWDAAGGAPAAPMPTYESATSVATGQVVKDNWKRDLGFDVTIGVIDGATLVGSIYNQAASKFTIACVAVSHSSTVSAELQSYYTAAGNRNGGHLNDPTLEDLVTKQGQEFDTEKRKDLLFQIQRRILENGYYLPVGSLAGSRYFNAKVQGIPELTFGAAVPLPFETMWLSA